jgi:hypothetical protein
MSQKTFILEPDGTLYFTLSSEPTFKLPIGKTTVRVAVPTVLTDLSAHRKFIGGKTGKHVPKHVPLSHLTSMFGIRFLPKQSYIFMKNATTTLNYGATNARTNEFQEINDGRSFIPILFDLSATELEFKQFLSPNSTLQTYVDYNKPGELVGVQAISYDLKDIVKFAHDYDNKNISQEDLNKLFFAIFGTNAPYAPGSEAAGETNAMPARRGRQLAFDILMYYFNSPDTPYTNFVVFENLLPKLSSKRVD